MSNKLTGKASYLTYNAQKLAIQKVSAKADRKLADTTDSDDYDATTDLIYPSQLPVMVTTELEVEGRFNITTTNVALLAPLYSGAAAVPVVFGLSAGVVFGHGNFDVSNFSCDAPIDDVVTWKATLKSNGKFTVGS